MPYHAIRFTELLVQPASLLIYLFIIASTKLAFVCWDHLKSIDKKMAQQPSQKFESWTKLEYIIWLLL